MVPEVECPDCNYTFWLDGDVRDADFHLEIPEDGKVYCPFCFPSVQLWPRMEPQEAAAAARRRHAAPLPRVPGCAPLWPPGLRELGSTRSTSWPRYGGPAALSGAEWR